MPNPFERVLSSFDEQGRARHDLMEDLRRRYLDLDRDDEVAGLLAWMLGTTATRINPGRPHGPSNRAECRSLVVTGESGAGKTRLIHHAFATHPALADFADPEAPRIAISVMLPSPCTLQAMGQAILTELGYQIDRPLGETVAWARVRRLLEKRAILVVHLDEMHNVTETANTLEMAKIRKTLKALMATPRWPVALVVSGLPHVTEVMEAVAMEPIPGQPIPVSVDRETEVRRRFRFVHLKPLSLPGELDVVRNAAEHLAGIAGFVLPEDFETEIAPRLVHAVLYQYGTCLELVGDAIETMLNKPDGGTVLTIGRFADAYAERTGNAAHMNPFLAPDWSNVDCRAVLRKREDEPPRERAPGPRGQGRRS